jgi:heptosyltransferase-2
MVSYYLALTSAITPSRDAAPPQAPRLSVDASQIAAQQAHFGLGDYWVFAPGAEFGPAKQWPLEHWQALLGLIPSAQRLAILGGPRDHAFGEALAQSAKPGQRVANLCGQTTMAQAIALIAGARLLVSNDSGLMHVAAALAKPQIAVFGSTDPMHSGPINPQAIVQWLKLDCSPCFQRHCPLTHHDCLRNISPEVLARDLRSISAKTTMLAP